MLSRNTICFEGICRVYRNAVVSHLRNVLSNKYPNDWQSRIATPFQREWEDIRKSAEIRRTTRELAGPLRDDADLLDVHHFYNLFEAHFEDLFVEVQSMSSVERNQKKQAVLAWSRSIKNLRDPVLGHPTDDDVSWADAFSMLDAARRILESFSPADAVRVTELRDSVIANDADSEVMDDRRVLESSTLPSRESIAQRFVGRHTELEALQTWLNDTYSRVWLLAGDGGKGKTAIAYRFVETVLQNPPPGLEIVIWLSAKARRFVSGMAIDIEAPDFNDLESALDCVLHAYGDPDVGNRDLKGKEEECRTYLAQLPALIILDDVDSLEDEHLNATLSYFLFKNPSMESKILLTSRRIPLGMEHTQVRGFEAGSRDGLEFIGSRVAMYELDLSLFPRATMNGVLEACDGSPLFVQDLLRLCKVGETPKAAIDKWRRDGGEAARRYALEREFEMLSLRAKMVLLCCALHDGPVSLPEIQSAGDISVADSHDAIQDLQNLFLVPRPHLVEGIQRFSLNSNTRQLVLDVLGNTDLAQRIRNAIRAISGQAHSAPGDRERVGQYIRQAVTLVKLGRHQSAEETLLQGLDAFPENATLHGSLGWVYKAWRPQRRYTDARTRFARAAQLRSPRLDTYRHWWDMESANAEWTAAADAADRGIEVLGSVPELCFMAGFARSHVAKDLYQQAQYGRAEQEAQIAEAHLKKALLDVDDLDQGQYRFHGRVHRAIVLNYEHLVRMSQSRGERGSQTHFLRLLASSLNRWANEHPGDVNASSERQRLQYRFVELSNYLSG